MHEVQDIQPCPLNHVFCRGVAARVGSVHLQWLEGRGQDSPKTMPSHSSRMPILYENLTDHWKSTNIATNTAQPRRHQNTHNDVSAFLPHPNTMVPPTSFCPPPPFVQNSTCTTVIHVMICHWHKRIASYISHNLLAMEFQMWVNCCKPTGSISSFATERIENNGQCTSSNKPDINQVFMTIFTLNGNRKVTLNMCLDGIQIGTSWPSPGIASILHAREWNTLRWYYSVVPRRLPASQRCTKKCWKLGGPMDIM